MKIHRGDLFWILPTGPGGGDAGAADLGVPGPGVPDLGVPDLGAGGGIASDPAPNYRHPHVVVQDDVFNHSRIGSVVVCALTSNLHRASEPGNVLLDPGEGDLPKQSVVVVSQIASVDKGRLGQRIGSLSARRVEQILDGLRFQQRAFFER